LLGKVQTNEDRVDLEHVGQERVRRNVYSRDDVLGGDHAVDRAGDASALEIALGLHQSNFRQGDVVDGRGQIFLVVELADRQRLFTLLQIALGVGKVKAGLDESGKSV